MTIDLDFATVEPQILPTLKHMADVWERRGAGPFDDLVQEGRIAMLDALTRYQPAQANLRTYTSAVLTRTYAKMLRDQLRKKRVPYIWQRSEEGWRQVPWMPDVLPPDEDLPDPGPTGEGPVIDSMDQDQAFFSALSFLDEWQQSILRLYLQPTAELLAVAYNLSGSYTVTTSHLAAYLGVTRPTVDYTLRRIRQVIASLDTAGGGSS